MHRARNRTIDNSGGPVSIVSNDNRVSISLSNVRGKSDSIAQASSLAAAVNSKKYRLMMDVYT